MGTMTLSVSVRTALAVLPTAFAGCAYNFPGPEPALPQPPATLAEASHDARQLLADGDPGAARQLLEKWVDEARAGGSDDRLAAA